MSHVRERFRSVLGGSTCTLAVAVQAIYEALKRLKEGTALADLKESQAPPELLRAVNRTEELLQWQQDYLRSSGVA